MFIENFEFKKAQAHCYQWVFFFLNLINFIGLKTNSVLFKSY